MVPFLSGGIDSSTNTALFSEGEGGPIRTFCIGYDRNYGTYQNETEYARLMAREVGAEYHERILSHGKHSLMWFGIIRKV
ncbi:hypothetical protein KAW18_09240 [candidate division WOR-3 bacterium]|nr:hypothetical protein [candidate division WOR-3 bacterium]